MLNVLKIRFKLFFDVFIHLFLVWAVINFRVLFHLRSHFFLLLKQIVKCGECNNFTTALCWIWRCWFQLFFLFKSLKLSSTWNALNVLETAEKDIYPSTLPNEIFIATKSTWKFYESRENDLPWAKTSLKDIHLSNRRFL